MTTLGLHVRLDEITLSSDDDHSGAGPQSLPMDAAAPLGQRLADALSLLPLRAGAGPADVVVDVGPVVDGWLRADDPRQLRRVTAVRISPSPRTIQAPFDTFPSRVRRHLDGGWWHVPGGVDLNGGSGPALDVAVLDRVLEHARRTGSEAICLSSVGGLIDPSPELAAAEHLMRRSASMPLIMAHELGGRRFLEREAAAVVNAGLLSPVGKLLDAVVDAIGDEVTNVGLVCADGSLVNIQEARSNPVQLFGTELALLAQGAASLAEVTSAYVLAWAREQTRLLTFDQGVLRARHLRRASALSGVCLSQRHAAQSRVVEPAAQALSHQLLGGRPVILARAERLDDLASYHQFAQILVDSLPKIHVTDLSPGQLAATGAAHAMPQSEVLRYAVVTDRRDVERQQLGARRVAQGRVLSAVNRPVTLQTLSEYYSPLSFLPSGPILIRSHVVGRRDGLAETLR